MMSLMVDDLVRQLNSRLPQDDRETAITTIEHSGPPPDAYQVRLQEDTVLPICLTVDSNRSKCMSLSSSINEESY